MTEVVCVEPTLADDPSLPKLIERADEFRFLEVTRHGHGFKGEIPPESGRQVDQTTSVGRQLCQSGRDHCPQPRWHRLAGGRTATAVPNGSRALVQA